ncbi:transporter [Methylobacterium radiotolerans]|uniref:Ion transport 2 domain protein n=2 Tax=Methylobacterium radiotolerans TaxID=31998 RepID=B1M160_METRJ|nr:Ion transport 2 domain protein [Methylobacterium radiotolerans JCM 2831]KIU33370.1 transporter [Methylobacterium radiotolerans]
MLLAMTASVVLVTTTILVLYETLRLTSEHLAELPVPPRLRILAVVLMTFVGHTVAVWIYAGAYWLLVLRLGIGAFAGAPVTSFEDCLYFSVVAYTSLGFGDHFPTSHTRLLAGVEALNGLLLIGWSASFTYLAMERYWPLHGKAHAHRAAQARPSLAAERGRDRLFPPASDAWLGRPLALDQGRRTPRPAGSTGTSNGGPRCASTSSPSTRSCRTTAATTTAPCSITSSSPPAQTSPPPAPQRRCSASALASSTGGCGPTPATSSNCPNGPPEEVAMSHELTEPVHWQGRQWAVTGYGIEALDGMYHVPFSEIPDAEAGRPEWLDGLWRRYGTDRDDLAAALRVARTVRPGATPAPSKSAA